MISLVVAVGESGGIGKNNELLYKSRLDMQRFRECTLGHFCILGSKTFLSLPKPLKGRVNVVVSRNPNFSIDPHHKEEIILINDLSKVINHYKTGTQDKDLVICGGSEIYRQSLPYVDKVYLTIFKDDSKEYDSTFPLEYIDRHFEEVKRETHVEDGLEFDFIDYVRKVNVDGEN